MPIISRDFFNAAIGASPLAGTVTIGDDTDRMLIFLASVKDAQDNGMTVTFDPLGTPVVATEALPFVKSLVNTDLGVGIFYILDADLPIAGTYDLEIAWSLINDGVVVSVYYLDNATQAIPEVAMAVDYSTVSEFHTTLVPATSADANTFDCFVSLDNLDTTNVQYAADVGQNVLADVRDRAGRRHGCSQATAAGLVSHGWTRSVAVDQVYMQALASVAPASTITTQTGNIQLDMSVTSDMGIIP